MAGTGRSPSANMWKIKEFTVRKLTTRYAATSFFRSSYEPVRKCACHIMTTKTTTFTTQKHRRFVWRCGVSAATGCLSGDVAAHRWSVERGRDRTGWVKSVRVYRTHLTKSKYTTVVRRMNTTAVFASSSTARLLLRHRLGRDGREDEGREKGMKRRGTGVGRRTREGNRPRARKDARGRRS